MLSTLIKIFFISFLLNLLWEVAHSPLYETCLKQKLKKYVPTIITAAFHDGLWITAFYLVTVALFRNFEILTNISQLITFIAIALVFSGVYEVIAIRTKRWKYTKEMPLIFDVGISPLLQLVVTGVISFILSF